MGAKDPQENPGKDSPKSGDKTPPGPLPRPHATGYAARGYGEKPPRSTASA